MLKQRLRLTAIRLFSTTHLPCSEKLSADRKSGWGEGNNEGELKNSELPTSYLHQQNLSVVSEHSHWSRGAAFFSLHMCDMKRLGPLILSDTCLGSKSDFHHDGCDSTWSWSRSMADQSAVDLIRCGQRINVCPQNNYWNETGVCSHQNKPPWRNRLQNATVGLF